MPLSCPLIQASTGQRAAYLAGGGGGGLWAQGEQAAGAELKEVLPHRVAGSPLVGALQEENRGSAQKIAWRSRSET
jgi:hypothetical protein